MLILLSKNMAIKLNSAPSSVWNLHFKDSNNYKMAIRIKELSTIAERTANETKELKALIKAEKDILNLAFDEDNKWNSILSKISELSRKLNDDERLLLHFDLRLEAPLKNNLIQTPEDVEKIFHEMMAEDMDLSSHEEMNEIYEQIKANDFSRTYSVPLDEEDFNYVYEQPLLQEEESYLKERVDVLKEAEGKNLSQEELNRWLMLRVIRLERVINEYYDLGEDIIGDEDDDND